MMKATSGNMAINDIRRGAVAEAGDVLIAQIKDDCTRVIDEFFEKTDLKKGSIFVVGCSSSEILGSAIGHGSSYDTALEVYRIISQKLSEHGIFLAAQCCEHLNRAIVVERECAEKYMLEEAAVIPQPKAGGSFATVAYENMEDPVVVEHIKASAGIDIGGTLIGMHLKDVAVPLRLSVSKIGKANIICAYTRPKFIGGCRAVYSK